MNAPNLPELSPAEQSASDALVCLIADEIAQEGGSIPFPRFMELALYAPQYGYYTGGARKIGAAGEFVTAPLLSPLFGRGSLTRFWRRRQAMCTSSAQARARWRRSF